MDKGLEMQKPKYQLVKEYIIETIKQEGLEPGDKIWSENQLAKKFKVSRHTVRQAIGELANEGWLYKIHGKGTFVGDRLGEKSNKIKSIGVMTTYLNDYIFPSIILGIDEVLSKAGYNMVLGCTDNRHDKERLCLENFVKADVQGIIIEPTKSALPNPNLDVYKQIINKGIPIFFIHGSYQELDCPYVVVDDVEAGYLATDYLIKLGHKNIGGIFKIDDIQGHYRFKGYQMALADSKIEVKDSNILWFDTDDNRDEFIKRDHEKFEDLIKSCSAIVCYNDQIALKVVNTIRNKGLSIPDDISLVSFDDSQLAVVSDVKLTTVAHPQQKLGRIVAESLINKINGGRGKDKIRMEAELIIRDSAKEHK